MTVVPLLPRAVNPVVPLTTAHRIALQISLKLGRYIFRPNVLLRLGLLHQLLCTGVHVRVHPHQTRCHSVNGGLQTEHSNFGGLDYALLMLCDVSKTVVERGSLAE